jgi:hypothetical protein
VLRAGALLGEVGRNDRTWRPESDRVSLGAPLHRGGIRAWAHESEAVNPDIEARTLLARGTPCVMSNWVPLSVRRGIRPVAGMVEGVPQHLVPSLEYWAEEVFGYRGTPQADARLVHAATLAVHATLSNKRASDMMHDLISYCKRNEDSFLDLIDYLLSTSRGDSRCHGLEHSLSLGGSAWMAVKGEGLKRRVDAVAQESFDVAVTPADLASEELKQAWDRAFSRGSDASDAWDHAIKAVEAVLIPIVAPSRIKRSWVMSWARLGVKGSAGSSFSRELRWIIPSTLFLVCWTRYGLTLTGMRITDRGNRAWKRRRLLFTWQSRSFSGRELMRSSCAGLQL